jgi:hypothetical protein
VIEENGGTRHAAPTPSELGQGQEEEEDLESLQEKVSNVSKCITKFIFK